MRPRTQSPPNPSFWIGECKGSLMQVRDGGVRLWTAKETEISHIFVQKQYSWPGDDILSWLGISSMISLQ